MTSATAAISSATRYSDGSPVLDSVSVAVDITDVAFS